MTIIFYFFSKYFIGKGGAYNGNSIRLITQKKTLDDLEQMLPQKFAKPVCDYLRITRKVYELSMAKDVSPDYHKHFMEFKRAFLVLHKLIKLQWTVKVLMMILLMTRKVLMYCRFT